MPFGLQNAPAAFHRIMDIILSSVKWHSTFVYLDDIVVFSKAPEQQLNHLQRVLKLVQDTSITRKIRKCFLFAETISYYGHTIPSDKLEIVESSTNATQ